jgi:hypothetical protein
MIFTASLLACALVGLRAPAAAQQESVRIVIEPSELTLGIGESLRLSAAVVDGDGAPVPDATLIFYSLARAAVSVSADGMVTAHQPGTFQVAAMLPLEVVPGEPADRTGRYDAGARAFVTVTIPAAPLQDIDWGDLADELVVGTHTITNVVAHDESRERLETDVDLASEDSDVVEVGEAGTLRAVAPGSAVIRATRGELSATRRLTVVANPAHALQLAVSRTLARTGDVVTARAVALDDGGSEVDVPVRYGIEARPDPARPASVGAGAAAQITVDGRFVAEQPGLYGIVASVGDVRARQWVTVVARDVGMEIEPVGHAPIRDRVTSDLWVWEGVDGRDYAIVGTWNAEGHAYFYDVTDPSAMRLVDRVQVDARTVNDVKISEDGRIAVISREGASNRRNGLVVLDVSDPSDVTVLSQFDDELTGGVHNVFIHREHVYAVNNGRRVDIISIEDPARPFRVGRFETDTPGRSVHDVWVHEGIAYEAGRTDGLVIFDVGGGEAGGAPNNPVEIARIPQLTGWNHSAWPYESPSTGRRYVLGGDEAFYRNPMAPESGGINWREKLPSRAKGWIHFVDITDPANPSETARYQVPESGPHNYWIDEERELLYIGHFDAGLRVVDISGELLGDLYRQGREVAHFYTDDPEGFIPNAPFVWGPQPHKGTIFMADFSSGLWAVRLRPREGAKDVAPATAPAFAEESAGADPAAFAVRPAALRLAAGDTARLEVTGAGDDAEILFFSRSPLGVSVTPDGRVTAHRPGDYEVVAMQPGEGVDREVATATDAGQRRVVRVTVTPSAATRLEFVGVEATVRAGDLVPLALRITDATGASRDVRAVLTLEATTSAALASYGSIFDGSADAHPFYRRERPDVYPGEAAALLDTFAPGSVRITAAADGMTTTRMIEIVENPAAAITLSPPRTAVVTGDVVPLQAQATDAAGNPVSAPIRFELTSHPDRNAAGSRGAGAPAQVLPDGRFVAEQPGIYLVAATSGSARAETALRVTPRDVRREISFLGHGPVHDRVTSDLWVWEGVDGRDYAITGTWQSEGHAYFWDVTDPTRIQRIAEIQVDARTVNDVKVSADGRLAVISREGASNRRNGLVLLDVTDPRAPTVLSRFDDDLTGGVHNVFIHEDHVYAINNGRRWDVINIEDPTRPVRVGRFESSIPGRSVHDVWVRDGIAYQAGNTEGIVVIDVGGGGQGGTPANPVEIGRMPQLTGWTHAVWPFYSRSTGKFYVIAGDESHPVNPRDPANIISVDARMVSRAMGWLHFIEFDDRQQPREVARYRVPEAGPHNLWIDWDAEVMYVAYFNGGLRIVDVSGELVGDLYRQGREIAKFYSDDLEGFIPNAPMVWGPQPYKGSIFFSDFHSGLWAVRLGERESAGER